MTYPDLIRTARDAAARREWRTAFDCFQAADSMSGELTLDDLHQFAVAAHLLGQGDSTREILARAYHEALRLHAPATASRSAFWLGHTLIFSGDESQSAAWMSRAASVLDEYAIDGVERGFPLVPEGIHKMLGGDPEAASETLRKALAIGRQFHDPTLIALATHGLGRALIALGRHDEGMAALDETMVNVIEGQVSPLVCGELYCGLLEACHDTFDVRRAREWTAALTRWCASQPDLIAFQGPCMVHRVELLRLGGAWPDAIAEARRACEWLSAPASPENPADAYYELAELHRLRGEFESAEEAYRLASRFGRTPEPGLPLLWLARGQGDAALRAIDRSLLESGDQSSRLAALMAARVEVLVALEKTQECHETVTRLQALADKTGAPLLEAEANRAAGLLLLAENRPSEAIARLRRAWSCWQRLEAPYEAARERFRIGLCYRALGDIASAVMEFDAARATFEELGAAPDLRRMSGLLSGAASSEQVADLTAREVDVLRLVAAGRTNREIALELVISEHTVARHLQNMLSKLGFPSRTRLAAFAIERGIATLDDGQN
ncbi:MAG: LuxR C-terminal-related transcriptional regulator [Dehalococcoidia bacterium]